MIQFRVPLGAKVNQTGSGCSDAHGAPCRTEQSASKLRVSKPLHSSNLVTVHNKQRHPFIQLIYHNHFSIWLSQKEMSARFYARAYSEIRDARGGKNTPGNVSDPTMWDGKQLSRQSQWRNLPNPDRLNDNNNTNKENKHGSSRICSCALPRQSSALLAPKHPSSR